MARGIRLSFQPDVSAKELYVAKTLKPVSEYLDRDGYQPGFLDKQDEVAMPKTGTWSKEVAKLLEVARETGRDDSELRYTHFSCKVLKSRRLPLFSAVNINGKSWRDDVPRSPTWRFDPRIPKEFQILEECYGPERTGFFSRGHMTRRQDPIWGPLAEQANLDTFHAPNAAPQMQGFNGGIWNDLEDYLLFNTDSRMKISVFTGPIFAKADPSVHKVKIPVEFWKVVVFIHDRTREQTATAYTCSQAKYLPGYAKPAFVFGEFLNMQVPITRIEELTDLDFGTLRERDVLRGADPSFVNLLSDVTDVVID